MSLICRIAVGGLLGLTTTSGCALWRRSTGEISELPRPRMSHDSVVLEVCFVRLPSTDLIGDGRLWEEVDEQHLPTELRRRLTANGFRCGLVGMQLPIPLRSLLEDTEPSANPHGETGSPIESEATAHLRRLQSRAGRRGEIIASQTHQELAVLTHEAGQVCGERVQQAQCLLAVETNPMGDGRVRIELTPEVHFGQPIQKFVGHDGVFRLDTGRHRKVFDRLRIEAILVPGQTLIVTGTPEARGLGKHFFAEVPVGDAPQAKLLLIRLSQTQYDDLFAPGADSTPLVTQMP